MASTPKFKIYTASGEYVAATKYAEDAAVLIAVQGNGATVRLNHRRKLWTEGTESLSAAESYDYAASVINEREKMR